MNDQLSEMEKHLIAITKKSSFNEVKSEFSSFMSFFTWVLADVRRVKSGFSALFSWLCKGTHSLIKSTSQNRCSTRGIGR